MSTKEPRFNTFGKHDLQMEEAFSKCATTINRFISLLDENSDSISMAKLRFRDPDADSDELIYLWLSDVVYHANEKLLSGVFFEVPSDLSNYHEIGDRLGFDPEDVFDWMIIDKQGHMKGGFTIRVTRSRLRSQQEIKEYDEYIGVMSYEEID